MGRAAHEQETRVVLECLPRSVGLARAVVREAADGLPAALISEVELLTSEVVTNAIQHGGPAIELVAVVDEDTVVVSVHDDGVGTPLAATDDVPVESFSGRGLQMVEQVAQDWGVQVDEHRAGKTVWFKIGASSRD